MANRESIRLVGYARVSTRDQETYLQLDALHRAGVQQIYEEKTSSVSARPELQRCLSSLRPGDVLVVYKMDRIARSLLDLLMILDRIKDSGASVRSLTEPLDTSGPLGVFMVQILGAVAQLERGIIRERTVAGQVAAIKRGRVFGRPKKLDETQEAEVLRMLAEGWTKSATARHFDVSVIVVRRIADEAQGKKSKSRYPVLAQYLDMPS